MSEGDAVKRTTRWMTIAAATAAAVAGCGGDDGADGGGAVEADASYTQAIRASPGNLDPDKTVSEQAIAIFQYAYDYLVTVDADGKVAPGIAEKWDATPEKVTFTLKPDVQCADGSPVTATTVKRNLDGVQDPKRQSVLLGLAVPATGYTVKADDEARTVTMSLKQPFGLAVDALQLFPIVCGEGLEDRKLLETQTSGSGPYVYDGKAGGDRYRLTRRDGYAWGPGGTSTSPEMPKQVTLRVIENPSTTANLLLSGEVDAATVSGPDAQRLKAQSLPERTIPLSVAFTFHNQAAKRPGADPVVRKALAAATPREDLAKVLYDGQATARTGILSSAATCDDTAIAGAIPSGGVDAANAMLDEAGWKRGADGVRAKDGVRLRLSGIFDSEGPGYRSGIELLQRAWKQVGVDLRARGMVADDLVNAAFGGDWDVLPIFEIGVTLPSQFVPFASGPGVPEGQNLAQIDNADYDRLTAEAAQTAGAESCPLWTSAGEALAREADVVPLVLSETAVFSRPGVELAANAIGVIPTSLRVGKG